MKTQTTLLISSLMLLLIFGCGKKNKEENPADSAGEPANNAIISNAETQVQQVVANQQKLPDNLIMIPKKGQIDFNGLQGTINLLQNAGGNLQEPKDE